jgi:hypothetical protein
LAVQRRKKASANITGPNSATKPEEITVTIPREEDLADNAMAIRIIGDLDDLGHARFTAFWREDYLLTPAGVRGQVFHARLADFVRRNTRGGRHVVALDEHTRTLLDSLTAEETS